MAFAASSAWAANTEYDVTNGQTDLTAAATYTTNGTSGTGVGGIPAAAAPSVTSDVTFDTAAAYSPAAFTVNTSVTFGSINDLNTTALTVSNTGATASTLTLGGSGDLGDSVTGSNSADLLYVGTGANLAFAPGAGVLGVALGQSGNFDVVGTASTSAGISGGFGINKTGAGTLTLTGANTFTGGATLSSGTVILGSGTTGSSLGASTNTITFMGGALTSGVNANTTNVFGSATAANNGTITVAAGQTGTLNLSTRVQLDDAVTGAGTLNIVANTTVTRDDFQNNFAGFTGNLNLSGTGGIRLGINALGTGQSLFNAAGWASTTLSVDGVTINPTTNSGGNTIQIGALKSTGTTGSFAGGTAGGAPTYQIGALNASTTYSGTFTGNAIVTKVGTGVLTLASASTYTGATNVNAGTLTISANGGLGSGNATVAAGATLELSAGVTAAHGVATSTLTLSSTSSVVQLDAAAGTVQDTVMSLVVGTTVEPNGTYGGTGSNAATILPEFTGTGVLAVVPEPSTWALSLGGIAGLLAMARLRRRCL